MANAITKRNNKKRLLGLDLLRITSMAAIIALHFIGKNNLLSLNHEILLLIEIFCIPAVNCYILISGYFLIKSTFKPLKLLQLWLEMEFYSISIYLILSGFRIIDFLTYGLIKAFMPFVMKEYWFMNAYLLLYIISPFLNKLLSSLSKNEYVKLLSIELIFFCLWNFLPKDLRFDTSGGYGIIWFIVLYSVAGYIRLHFHSPKTVKARRFFLAFLVTVSISYFGGIIAEFILGSRKLRLGFLSYNNIFTLAESLFLFIGFKNLNIKCEIAKKLIEFVAPLTLAVYLIHENPFFRDILWKNILGIDKLITLSEIMPMMLFSVLVIFLACIAIDFLRKKLFSKIPLDKQLLKFHNLLAGVLTQKSKESID